MKTKAELQKQLEDAERRTAALERQNVEYAKRLGDCTAELENLKPKKQRFKLEVPNQYFESLTYDMLDKKARALLDLSMIFELKFD